MASGLATQETVERKLLITQKKLERAMALAVEGKRLTMELEKCKNLVNTAGHTIDSNESILGIVQILLQRCQNKNEDRAGLLEQLDRTREEGALLRTHLQEAIAMKDQELGAISAQVEQKQKEIRKIEADLAESKHQIAFLEGELATEKLLRRRVERSGQELQRKMDELETSYTAVLEKKEILEKQNEDLTNTCQSLSEGKKRRNLQLSEKVSTISIERDPEKAEATLASLRSKDILIEKLNRRLRTIETNSAVDNALRKLAQREASFDKIQALLRARAETAENKLRELMDSRRDCDSSTPPSSMNDDRSKLETLQKLVREYLEHRQQTEILRYDGMSTAMLLPALCCLSEADSELTKRVLSGLLPLPRASQ